MWYPITFFFLQKMAALQISYPNLEKQKLQTQVSHFLTA